MRLQASVTFRPRGNIGQFIATVITPAVQTSVEQCGEIVVEAAKAYCPVDTGDLRDSIAYRITEGSRTITAVVDAAMPYAGYVEYGTGVRGANTPGVQPGPYPYDPSWPGMVAQPFMRPALDETRSVIRETFASNLAAAMRV